MPGLIVWADCGRACLLAVPDDARNRIVKIAVAPLKRTCLLAVPHDARKCSSALLEPVDLDVSRDPAASLAPSQAVH